MDFSEFLERKNQLQKANLGGLDAQFLLAPEMRLKYNADKIKASNPKKAAVLALFYPNTNNETCFLLTERAKYKGTHSAQISFPGGKIDKKDFNLKETALRETFEEVGVPKNKITILRELTDVFIPPSNFLATPFLGYTDEAPKLITNYEVASAFKVPVKALLDNANLTSIKITTSYASNIVVPCFQFNG
ncbi:NUDIX hydrolase, partial [Bizionia sp.]|uniref:NUDIX hydrolase n=1 Tax=Bizionia sp. TaxID=1954480 RepID=UPI003A951A2A